MNMQTAPGKFLSHSIFLLSSLWLIQCSSSDGLQQRAELAEFMATTAEGLQDKGFVRLIDLEMAAQQPHLRPHQGQIVLGQDQLHLVMSSVPPLHGTSAFHPLLARIYKSAGKSWQAQTWLPPFEISIQKLNGEALQLIGQDMERQSSQNKFVSYFRDPIVGGGQTRLELELIGENSMVKATLINQSIPGPLRWQLRLTPGPGEEHPIPLDQENFAGMTLNLLPDMLTILANSPMTIQSEQNQTLLTPITNDVSGKTAFFLLLGRDTALVQPALVIQLKQCLLERKKRSKLEMDCLRLTSQNTETWKLRLPQRLVKPSYEKRLAQALYVHDAKGGFIGSFPIFEGEQLQVVLPSDPNWELLYPDHQGILQKLKFDAETQSANLPALALGTIQVELKPDRPSFVEIRDAIRRESLSLASLLADRPTDVLSAHSFLQKTWPFQAQLPAGDYQLQVMDGVEILCKQSFTILAGQRQTLRCQSGNPQLELSTRANLSLDGSYYSDELLQASRFQAIGRTNHNPDKDNQKITEIPMLVAEDQNLGLSLRAFPADEAIRKAWLLQKPTDSEPLLPAFAKFVRQQSPPLQLVFKCPDVGFQLEEYRWLALAMRPDMIEVFGCQPADLTNKLLQVAHMLQQKSEKPIKLSTASPFPTRPDWTGFIPAIYVPNPAHNPAESKAESLINALREGHYSLGLRSEIAVHGDLPTPSQTAPQAVVVKIRSYDLKDQGALIRIFDQNNLLTEQAIAPSREPEQSLRIHVRLHSDSRFLRFELLSQGLTADAKNNGLTQPFLLATSNFLSLNGQP